MDALANVAHYDDIGRNGTGTTWAPGLFLSPTQCRSFEHDREDNNLNPSPTTSDMSSAQKLLSWKAAATGWNKAMGALTGSKARNQGPVPEEDDEVLFGTGVLCTDTATADGNSSPQHVMSVLLSGELSPSSEDTCSLSGASCSRRSCAKKTHGCNKSPSEDLCSATSPGSPGTSFYTMQVTGSQTSELWANLLTGDFSTSFAPRSSLMRAASSPARRANEVHSRPLVKEQTSSTSVACMRKAISAPLVKAGIMRKCKEKQE